MKLKEILTCFQGWIDAEIESGVAQLLLVAVERATREMLMTPAVPDADRRRRGYLGAWRLMPVHHRTCPM